MDTLRQLLPSALIVLSAMAVIWAVVFFVKRETQSPEVIKGATKIRNILFIFILLFYVFFVIRTMSVNDIPRSSPDKSLHDNMRDNFEERMKSDTTKH